MATLLEEIDWGAPLLPRQRDPLWEAQVKRRAGHVSEVDRRIAASPWLREAGLGLTSYRPLAMPQRLFQIGAMVTSQENACRYCYGANRAYMKILGYSEDFIHHIERDLHLAELDDRERAFIGFCRNLARSRPRPSRAASDALVAMGFSRLAVHEMAFMISMGCFYNRVSTFIACPPEQAFERMANGPLGRIIALAAPLLRLLGGNGRGKAAAEGLDTAALAGHRFAPVLLPLAGLPAARVVRDALDGALASEVLGRTTTALMFAVVARTMDCSLCEAQAVGLLADEGVAAAEVAQALAHLRSDRLAGGEASLLAWTRGTVYYETAKIQQQTRALAAELEPRVLLEAIGVAALANAVVRLAMLHE